MRIGTIKKGARGIDTGAVVPPAWLRLHPQDFVMRYICNTKPLTKAEQEVILASGAGLVYVLENWQACNGKVPWSADVGRADGKAAVASLAALEAPPGAPVAYAFEGVFQGKDTARAAWDAFAYEVRHDGKSPGLYVGPGCPFNEAELRDMKADWYWAFAGKPAGHGTDLYLLQQYPTEQPDGLPVDPDEVLVDHSFVVVIAESIEDAQFSFEPLPNESIRDRIVRCCETAGLLGHLGEREHPIRYRTFVSHGSNEDEQMATWRTSCGIVQGALDNWCGREVWAKGQGHKVPHVFFYGYLGPVSFQHPAWVENDGKAMPKPGDLFYIAPDKTSNNNHVGRFVRELSPGVWLTFEGGGGDGTRTGFTSRAMGPDFTSAPRRLLGWFDADKMGYPPSHAADKQPDTIPAPPFPTPYAEEIPASGVVPVTRRSSALIAAVLGAIATAIGIALAWCQS